MNTNENLIQIYKTENNDIEVQIDNETVWLTQAQMAELFCKDRTVITKHINNIFGENELNEKSSVQYLHIANSDKPVKFYNLDVIISVGYRVKSKQGTQFRQWATQRLKEYLIQDYTLNQKRLQELEKIINIIDKSTQQSSISNNQAKGLLDILTNYTKTFILLNQFDSNNLNTNQVNENISYIIEYEEAKLAIHELKCQLIQKNEATNLFGQEKDNSFAGTLQSVVQTFGGVYLYPSIEEQAANILYLVIKNHAFNDGNKRIGAFLFIWFLEKNKHRFKTNGELKINDNCLVALSLLVAQSNPNDKELIIQLIINLINDSK